MFRSRTRLDQFLKARDRFFVYRSFFFFSSRRRHTRYWRDWSSDVCSSDLSLDLEHAYARVHHLVHEVDSLQVFGRHDVFVVHIQLYIRLLVANGIAPPAYLHACAAVGRMVHLVKRQVAFARNCHAKRSVTEHLDTDLFAAGTADVLFSDDTVDFRHLLQIQLASQHHDIGKLSVKPQRFRVRYVQLSRQVHLLPDTAGIVHHRHIGSDHSGDTRPLFRVDRSEEHTS